MLTGNAGRTGGIFALQRENNARGAGDMGALPDYLPGYLRVDDAANRRKFEDKWRCKLPGNLGRSALEIFDAAKTRKIKGLFVMGENPVVGFPQPDTVKEALASLGFLVVTDLFLSETAAMADVVMPAAAFTEKEGTFTNFEGRVQRLHKVTEPAGQSRSDSEIIQKLAEAMAAPISYASQQDVMEEIEEMVPFYSRVHLGEKEREETGFGDLESDSPGTRRLHKGLFPSGFGRFSPVAYKPAPENSGEYPFTLIVGSVRYGFGSGSRSARSARLSKYNGDAQLGICSTDARKLGIGDGDTVKVISPHGEVTIPVQIDKTLSPGLLFTSISSPEVNVNRLFSNALNKQTKAPAVKSCAARLEKVKK
jgi:predicted molibdopterin-dependent oxidoreductase YjgC